MKYEKELQIAIEAACSAGDVIMTVYQTDFDVSIKKDTSPVTEADIAANHVILNMLKSAFPEDGFLSEEVRDDESRLTKKRFWVIDPLDGTKEFIKKNDEFAVNIGLVVDGDIHLGLVYLPVSRKVYYGIRGEGAYVRSCESTTPRRIFVSKRRKPYHLLVSRSHPSEKTLTLLKQHADEIETVTEMGSAIKGCLIAEGLYDVYYNFGHSRKWDTCAMECIVAEAGGVLRKLDGVPIDYMEKDTLNRGFYIVNSEENCVDLTQIL
ncbi:3'(2'),5'-bisphosphate nucleotidase CysQ family protein [Fusibacter sp. JL298sf-3]